MAVGSTTLAIASWSGTEYCARNLAAGGFVGRIRSILVTAVLAVTAVGVVAVPAAHAVGGTISGVVRDTAGIPIAGATVFTQVQPNSFNFPNFSATTDAAGNYTISGLGPATWKVVAFAPGFAIRWGNASTFDAGASVVITANEFVGFDVTLPRKTASVSGRVTDPAGNPIADLTVGSRFNGGILPSFIPGFDQSGYFAFGKTDADGRYLFTGLAPMNFTVNFSPMAFGPTGPPPPSPYLEEWYLDSHSPATATPVELAEGVETTGIDAQLDLGATISGRVTDANGNPVAGVNVFSPANIDTGGTTTDANGMYTLIGIPPGDLAFVEAYIEDPRFLPSWYGGANFDTAAHLQIGLGQVIEGIDIQLQTPGEVNVAVFRPDGSLAPSVFVPCIAPGVPIVVPHPAQGFGPLVQCSSGGQVTVSSSPGGASRIPVGTYNAISAEGIGTFGVTTLNPSAVASFTLTADAPIDCVFTLGGTASCSPSDPATNDGDGLPPVVEDGAPNNGDGNSDGIRDAQQSNVSSLPAAVGGGYVTLAVPASLQISGALVSPQPPATQPFETGSIGITVQGLPIGGTADITVLRTVGGTATELWAFNHQTFKYSAVPAEFSGSTITAHIIDGGDFDSGNSPGPFSSPPDGAVTVFMTPVIPDRTPPTISCPSPDPVFAVSQFTATITATVTDSGTGVVVPPPSFPPIPPFPGSPPVPPFTQSVPTFVAGPGSVTFTASDRAGNTATATCSYSVIEDGDGVPPSAEPGDDNGDGIADAIQSNVAKASDFFVGVNSVVIASPPGTQLTNVSLQSSLFFSPPPGQTLDSGVVSSTISNLSPGQNINVDLIQTAARGTTFLQFTGFGWIALPATFNGQRLTVSVTDGGRGDNDGSVNGSISFSGAAATGETTPPTITCGLTPTFRQNQQFASVSATVSDAGSGVASPFLLLPADTSVLGTHSVTFVAFDLAGNEATQSCDYIVFDDGDGVAADVEDAAPNNGDGNLDGIPDSLQSNVASLPTPIGGGYTTILSFFGDVLTDVSATDFAGTPAVPSSIRLESGLYRFTVHASFAAVPLLRTSGSANYVLVSPIDGTWQQVSSFLNDGGFGDADGVVNGQISYVVAPATVDSTPPTITCPTAPSFILNQPGATLSASVFDGESGVSSPSVIVPLATSTVGTNSVAVTASDLVGNTTTVSCTYNVGVKLDRLSSPNPAVTTNVKGGRPVPIRWRAVDFNGRPVTDPNHFLGITLSGASCTKGRDADLDSVRDRGLRYLGNGQWEFDWTPPRTKGCYVLQLSLAGASKTARVSVR